MKNDSTERNMFKIIERKAIFPTWNAAFGMPIFKGKNDLSSISFSPDR